MSYILTMNITQVFLSHFSTQNTSGSILSKPNEKSFILVNL